MPKNSVTCENCKAVIKLDTGETFLGKEALKLHKLSDENESLKSRIAELEKQIDKEGKMSGNDEDEDLF